MSFSRRDFIKSGAVAAVAALGLRSSAAGQTGITNSALPDSVFADSLYYQTAESFRPHLNSEFSLMTETVAATAVLIEVKELVVSKTALAARKSKFGKPTAECFSLVFRVASPEFAQNTYSVWHPHFGKFDLFLVPGKSAAGEALLRAVFNRL